MHNNHIYVIFKTVSVITNGILQFQVVTVYKFQLKVDLRNHSYGHEPRILNDSSPC